MHAGPLRVNYGLSRPTPATSVVGGRTEVDGVDSSSASGGSDRRAMLVEIVEMIRYEGEGITGELKVIHKGLGKIEGRLTEPELQKYLQG